MNSNVHASLTFYFRILASVINTKWFILLFHFYTQIILNSITGFKYELITYLSVFLHWKNRWTEELLFFHELIDRELKITLWNRLCRCRTANSNLVDITLISMEFQGKLEKSLLVLKEFSLAEYLFSWLA